MGKWVDVGRLDAIAEPGSRGFDLEGSEGSVFFVVRKGGAVYAYRNRCPHTGAPLEWLPHEFLDLDKSFIECAMHGALFRPDNGLCLRGPCAGDSLQALQLRLDGGRVSVEVSPLLEPQEP